MYYHPKKQILKTEQFTQTDEELSRKVVSHKRKETKNQGTQTTDDLQMDDDKEKKRRYQFTHTVIKQQTINAKCEHDMDIHIAEHQKGNTGKAINHNNLYNDKLETETEKKPFKGTQSSKAKKKYAVQKIKFKERKLINMRKNKDTHTRNIIPIALRTAIRRQEQFGMQALQKNRRRLKREKVGLQRPTAKRMDKRKHLITMGKLVRNRTVTTVTSKMKVW
ncbi:unnamed protein product [Mytilus coruscus]|uniref:Uncharacterized protein n=1 Tax=Mytilus coruscus TaxID=42192 RepID=A0A6J8A6M1_MYTCO|nr:unnamed protein product [Mytilus coruscus]